MKNTLILICLIFWSIPVHSSEITVDSLAKVIVRFEAALERTGFDPQDCDNVGSYADDRACLEEKRSSLTQSFARFSRAISQLTGNNTLGKQLIQTHTLWEEWFEADRMLYMYFSAGNGSGVGGFTDEEFLKRLKKKIELTEQEYIQYFIRKRRVSETALKKKLSEFRKLLETAGDLCPQHDYDYKTDKEIIRTPQKCDKAIAIYENILGRDCEEIIDDSIIKIELLISTGSDEEALRVIDKIMKMLSSETPDNEYKEALLTELSADAYSHLGHPATAVYFYDRAVYKYKIIIENRDYKHRYDANYNISDIDKKRVTAASMRDRKFLQKRFSESMESCLKNTQGTGEYCASELHTVLAKGYIRIGDTHDALLEYETAIKLLLSERLAHFHFSEGFVEFREYLERYRYYLDEYLEQMKDSPYCSTAAGYVILWNSDPFTVLKVVSGDSSPHDLFMENCNAEPDISETGNITSGDACIIESCPCTSF